MNPLLTKGEIPTFLQKMTKLEDLSLKATQRNGKIPTWLNEMTSLILLDVDSNNLHGEIPDLGQLTDLKFVSHMNLAMCAYKEVPR